MVKINKITEQINLESNFIDQKNVDQILDIINKEDATVSESVKKSLPQISNFIQKIIKKLKKGGRLIYIGSGTSGRRLKK